MDTFECGHDLPAQQTRDPLEQAIYDSISGVQKLRSQVKRLEAELEMSRSEASHMRVELEALRFAMTCVREEFRAELEHARNKADYYHRFSVETATSLNLICQICDEVMQKAQREAYQRPEDAASRSDLPELVIPPFLPKKPRNADSEVPFGAPAGKRPTQQ